MKTAGNRWKPLEMLLEMLDQINIFLVVFNNKKKRRREEEKKKKKKKKKKENIKNLQHPVFPGGLPSKY